MSSENIDNKENIIIEGINQILDLDDTSFDVVFEKLFNARHDIFFSYIYESNSISKNKQIALEKIYDNTCIFLRKEYFNGELLSVRDILSVLNTYKNTMEKDSPKYYRAQKLLMSRNLSAFKSHIPINKKLNKTFEIVSNDDTLQKFLDYNNNLEYFSVNGQAIPKSEYIQYLDKIFGERDNSGNFSNDTIISKDFYIPELDEYKKRFSIIYDNLNVERYTNPEYEFREMPISPGGDYSPIRKDVEPNWTLNPKLNDEVFKDMPKDLSLEEKTMFIYCKLCKIFTYDDGYFYKNQLDSTNYTHKFSKQHLESITPNSKITCWDFARILSKMINSLDGDIEALILAEGINKGHFSVGFYTDKVSAILDAVDGQSGGTNDLMKGKNGIAFEGIRIISDKNNVLEKATDKVYPMVFGKTQLSIKDYVDKLHQTQKNYMPFDIEKAFETFSETMKNLNIYGDEAIQTFISWNHLGFFGKKLEKALIGKKETRDGKTYYSRSLLIRNPSEETINNNPVYWLDADTLTFSKKSREESIKKLASGEYIYESEKHKLPGIDVEVKE